MRYSKNMKVFKALAAFFERKGILSTVLGFSIGIMIVVKAYQVLFLNVEFTEELQYSVIAFTVASLLFFMLPSTIKIISKIFTLEVLD